MLATLPVEPVPPIVSALSTPGWSPRNAPILTGDPASATWESANRAVYMPLDVPVPALVTRVWWANGATVSGGATIEVGLYYDAGYKPGVKIISGAAVQGSASEVQFVDVTDTWLYPGLYWLALTMSSVTNTTGFRNALSGTNEDALYRFEEASANPLPATATPVESTTTNAWLYGFSTTTIT